MNYNMNKFRVLNINWTPLSSWMLGIVYGNIGRMKVTALIRNGLLRRFWKGFRFHEPEGNVAPLQLLLA